MPIPDYKTFLLPVLKLAAERELPNKECVEKIAEQFSLLPEEREQLFAKRQANNHSKPCALGYYVYDEGWSN